MVMTHIHTNNHYIIYFITQIIILFSCIHINVTYFALNLLISTVLLVLVLLDITESLVLVALVLVLLDITESLVLVVLVLVLLDITESFKSIED